MNKNLKEAKIKLNESNKRQEWPRFTTKRPLFGINYGQFWNRVSKVVQRLRYETLKDLIGLNFN